MSVSLSQGVSLRYVKELLAGSGISFTETDTTITINSTGGGSSVTAGGSWNFNTSTSAADPGNKKFSFNNATLASVTAIYINDTNIGNIDASTMISFLSTGNRIYCQQESDGGKAAIFQVSGTPTDNTGWWTVPVTVVDSATLMDNNASTFFLFSYATAGGSGTPAGSNTEVQYNSSGSFGASNQFTYNPLTGDFQVNPSIAVTGAAGFALISGASTGAANTTNDPGPALIYGGSYNATTGAHPAGSVELGGGWNFSTDPAADAGDAYIAGGVASGGAHGSVRLATNNTDRLKIDGSGTWLLAGLAGTANQVLSSNGAGSPPTWKTVSGGGGGNTYFPGGWG